jgi:hypothetical protein
MRFELISPNPYGLWLELTGKGCQPMISLIHQCLPVSPSIIGVCINITKSHQKFRKKLNIFAKKIDPHFWRSYLVVYMLWKWVVHTIFFPYQTFLFLFFAKSISDTMPPNNGDVAWRLKLYE